MLRGSDRRPEVHIIDGYRLGRLSDAAFMNTLDSGGEAGIADP